jgi:hypothetical protein
LSAFSMASSMFSPSVSTKSIKTASQQAGVT